MRRFWTDVNGKERSYVAVAARASEHFVALEQVFAHQAAYAVFSLATSCKVVHLSLGAHARPKRKSSNMLGLSNRRLFYGIRWAARVNNMFSQY